MVGSVLNNGARAQYTALAAQTNFSYPFRIFADGDLQVWQTAAGETPDPVLDLLTLNVDYTVTGAGAASGGDVVLVVPATLNDVITIERNIPIERTFDYSVGGEFASLSTNQQLDKLTMTQQQNQMVNEERQLTYTALQTLTSGDTTLPKLANGQFWKKGDAGALVAVTLEESAGWSALRSELANNLSGADGARIVGYYDAHTGSTTVHNVLATLNTQGIRYGVTTGTPNAYEITLSNVTEYFNGLTITLRIHAPNTGAATININGLGAKNLLRIDSTALNTGDLTAALVYTFIYSEGSFFLPDIPIATESSRGSTRLATSGIVKTGTDTSRPVTSGNMIFHPGIAKAWGRFNGNGGAVILDSYNVSNVTRSGVGVYVVTLTNEMANTNYMILNCGDRVAAGNWDVSKTTVLSATQFRIETANLGSAPIDFDNVHFAVFGELA